MNSRRRSPGRAEGRGTGDHGRPGAGGPVRAVRRAVRARGPGARRARNWSGSSAPPGPTRASGPGWTACSASTPGGPRRSAARRGCRPNWASGCCSSARTWPTPAATRSTTWPAQALLARRLGKTALVAETGAGQHGVATATVAAHLGLGCTVYMGERDMARQELNVFRMELLGATVRPVSRRVPDAQGRHHRGAAALGHHRGLHPLLHRLGAGPAPVSVAGARVPAGHRRGGPRPVRRAAGPAAVRPPGRGGGLRGRRVERGRDVRGVRRHPGPAGRRGGRGRGGGQPRAARRAARLPVLVPAGRARPGHRG